MLSSSLLISIENVNGCSFHQKKKNKLILNDEYEILEQIEDNAHNSVSAFGGINTGVISKGKFIKGYKNGLWETTYKTKLVKTTNYNNGLVIGNYRVYNKNKLLYKTSFGLSGNGLYKDYYYKTGILKEEGYYENGKKEGEWCIYDRLGKKIKIIHYDNGLIK